MDFLTMNRVIGDEIIKKMYKKSAVKIREELGLRFPKKIRMWKEYEEGKIFGSDDIEKTQHPIIVGGPCLDHCNGYIEQLRINTIVDIVWPMCMAKRLQSECCIYLVVPNEEAEGMKKIQELKRWETIADCLEKTILNIGNLLKLKDLYIYRTDREAVDRVSKKWCSTLENFCNTSDALKGMYNLGSGTEEGNSIDPFLLENYEKNLVCYFPALLNELLNANYDGVIAVEHVHQGKAIKKAVELYKEISDTNTTIFHLAYLNSPSLTCKSRMARSASGYICISENGREMEEKLEKGVMISRTYWENCMPIEIRAAFNLDNDIDIIKTLSTLILKLYQG